MRKKMDKVMKQSQKIDEAFRAIKTETGIGDVQEMVKKFLTREQTYSLLLVNVSESEKKIDKLKKDNELLRSRLYDLKIDDSEAAKESGAAKFQDEDIIQMQ